MHVHTNTHTYISPSSEAQRYYMQVVQWIVTMENPFDRRLTEPEQMGQHCAMLLSVCCIIIGPYSLVSYITDTPTDSFYV